MNKHLRWFGRVTWLGIAVNAVFWVPALFFPGLIADFFNVADPEYRVWLRNAGMLLLVLSIWNAAGAHAPDRRPLFAWLVPTGRAIAALFFLEVWLFNSSSSSDRPEAFFWLFASDGTFAVVKATLLQLGMPAEHKLSRAGLARARRAAFSFPMFRKGAEHG